MGAHGMGSQRCLEASRRLVRTQIEELLALYRQYPLPEFESISRYLPNCSKPTAMSRRSIIRYQLLSTTRTRMRSGEIDASRAITILHEA